MADTIPDEIAASTHACTQDQLWIFLQRHLSPAIRLLDKENQHGASGLLTQAQAWTEDDMVDGLRGSINPTMTLAALRQKFVHNLAELKAEYSHTQGEVDTAQDALDKALVAFAGIIEPLSKPEPELAAAEVADSLRHYNADEQDIFFRLIHAEVRGLYVQDNDEAAGLLAEARNATVQGMIESPTQADMHEKFAANIDAISHTGNYSKAGVATAQRALARALGEFHRKMGMADRLAPAHAESWPETEEPTVQERNRRRLTPQEQRLVPAPWSEDDRVLFFDKLDAECASLPAEAARIADDLSVTASIYIRAGSLAEFLGQMDAYFSKSHHYSGSVRSAAEEALLDATQAYVEAKTQMAGAETPEITPQRSNPAAKKVAPEPAAPLPQARELTWEENSVLNAPFSKQDRAFFASKLAQACAELPPEQAYVARTLGNAVGYADTFGQMLSGTKLSLRQRYGGKELPAAEEAIQRAAVAYVDAKMKEQPEKPAPQAARTSDNPRTARDRNDRRDSYDGGRRGRY